LLAKHLVEERKNKGEKEKEEHDNPDEEKMSSSAL
jgi:hypothetical protein